MGTTSLPASLRLCRWWFSCPGCLRGEVVFGAGPAFVRGPLFKSGTGCSGPEGPVRLFASLVSFTSDKRVLKVTWVARERIERTLADKSLEDFRIMPCNLWFCGVAAAFISGVLVFAGVCRTGAAEWVKRSRGVGGNSPGVPSWAVSFASTSWDPNRPVSLVLKRRFAPPFPSCCCRRCWLLQTAQPFRGRAGWRRCLFADLDCCCFC